MRILFLLIVSFVSASSFAETKMMEYKVRLYEDSVKVPFELPVEKVEKYRNGVTEMALNIASCNKKEGSYENPLIGRVSTYKVLPSNIGCRFKIRIHDAREYSCILPGDIKNRLSSAILKRSQGDSVLGDFSPEEREVFFDPKICDNA
jgi:hypothetical protein